MASSQPGSLTGSPRPLITHSPTHSLTRSLANSLTHAAHSRGARRSPQTSRPLALRTPAWLLIQLCFARCGDAAVLSCFCVVTARGVMLNATRAPGPRSPCGP
eukprot:11226759-Prorocentrum_lima.AAC.1